jgi:hypothetical protein
MLNMLTSTWYMKIMTVVIALFLILLISALVSRKAMDAQIEKESAMLLDSLADHDQKVITEEDIKDFPEPIHTWLKNVGIIGKKPIRSMTLEQTGSMRLNPDQKWMTPKAKQYINVKEPGYLWHVDLPMMWTKGRDLFYQGDGEMLIKLGGLIPVVNEKDNEKINESSLHRFLMEIPWYPTAALADYISFEAIDDTRAKATMTYQGMTVDANFVFENDELIRVETMRYKDTDDSAKRMLCIGEMKTYDTFSGISIPSSIEITWVDDGTRFTWYKLDLLHVSYT